MCDIKKIVMALLLVSGIQESAFSSNSKINLSFTPTLTIDSVGAIDLPPLTAGNCSAYKGEGSTKVSLQSTSSKATLWITSRNKGQLVREGASSISYELTAALTSGLYDEKGAAMPSTTKAVDLTGGTGTMVGKTVSSSGTKGGVVTLSVETKSVNVCDGLDTSDSSAQYSDTITMVLTQK